MIETTGSILVALLYLASAALSARELLRAPGHAAQGVWRRLAPAGAGAVLHSVLLTAVVLAAGGLSLGFYNALSLAAFVVVALYLLLAALRPAEMLGIGLLPIAACSVLVQILRGDADGVPISGGLQFHIVVSLLAYAVLSVGAMQAILVGLQGHLLRTHQPGGFVRALPPLSRMEELLFQLLGVGFVLLSIGLLSGFVYLEDMFAQHLVHKTTLSLVAWSVFALLLLGRYAWGWRGQRAMRLTLLGLGFLLLAFFGSKFVLELVLQRG